jgi:hypothetical protein
MKEAKNRPTPISGEILDAWINVYEKARKRGLAPNDAREYANVRTSFQATQDWLDTYAVARWEGLSEELAMSFSNAGALGGKGHEHHKGRHALPNESSVKLHEVKGEPTAVHLEPLPSEASPVQEQDKATRGPLRGLAKRLRMSHK